MEKEKEKEKNIIIKFVGEYLNNKIWNGKGYNIKSDLVFEIENRKGKVIEYGNEGEIIFEGEYLNGERNGKGKEYYYNRKIIFEGEYLNGKIWNGKGYNKKGNLTFEIRNGNGKIIEYNNERDIIFEGDVEFGKKINGKRIIKLKK